MVQSQVRSHRRWIGVALVWPATVMAVMLGLGQQPAVAADDGLVPVLLKDVSPGTASSSPSKFTQVGGKVIFVATDPTNGQELRVTDGTAAGTVLLKDIGPGAASAGITTTKIGVAGSTAYFGANDSFIGTELWKTDGTPAGTVLVKDINTSSGTASSSPTNFTAVGSTMYFTANDGVNGTELWKTDGTEAGTVMVKNISAGSGSASPANLTVLGTTLYFSASDGGVAPASGTELWKSDGTAAGTVLVKDINPGPPGSSPSGLVVLGSTLIFSATNGNVAPGAGTELWSSDGTDAGTVLLKDVNPGTSGSSPSFLTVAGSNVYFSATGSSASSVELWKSDGTTAGTVLVKELAPAFGAGSFPSSLVALGTSLLFQASNNGADVELYISDGTVAGTFQLKDINVGTGSSNPTSFAVLGSTAYFSATSGATLGTELWKSDGTAAGTVLSRDIAPGAPSSSPANLTTALGSIYFSASNGTTGVATGIEPYRLRTNAAPVAVANAFSTRISSPITIAAPGVLGNDTDADGDVLTAGSASVPANGTVILNADGSFTYTPTTGFAGTDTFTYVASDGLGGTATATVTMTVAGINNAPVAGNDSYGTNEDTPRTVAAPGVLANDTDPDADILSAGSASTPAHGTVALNADGSFTYTPTLNYNGPDSFTYVARDIYSGTSTGTVNLAVAAVNDAPVAAADSYATNSDTPVTVPAAGVLSNDTDVEGDVITAGSASAPAHGSVALSADGSFTYTPSAGFFGIDTFTYVASDPNGGSSTGTVTLNVFGSGSVTSVKGSACPYFTKVGLFGGPQTVKGCGSGVPTTDVGYSPLVTLPGTGSVSPITGSDVDGAAGVYGPAFIHGGIWPENVAAPTRSGPQLSSTQGTLAAGSVTSSADITLKAPPYPAVGCAAGFAPPCLDPGGFGPPPVWGDSLHAECSATKTSVSGFTRFSNSFVASATDPDGSPLASATEPIPQNPPVNYTRSGIITNVGDVFTVVLNQQIVNADGSLTVNAVHMYLFGPTAVGELVRGQVTCGTTPTTVSASDTVAPTCSTAIVQPISPTNPAPLSPRTELVGVFDAGTGAAPTGLVSITNIQATNAIVSVPGPGTSYLNFVPGQTGPLPVTAQRTAAAESANLPMKWSFDATDAAGNVTHCRGADNAPAAVNESYATAEDVVLTVPAPGVLANDTDFDADTLTAVKVTDPAHGTVSVNVNGSFTYTPAANYNGPDSFTYKANDGFVDSSPATVTLTVTAVNDAPVAVADNVTTAEDTAVTVPAPGVLGNDTDVEGSPLTAAKVTDPAHGTVSVNANGSFTYTPVANYNGPDSFTYKANDGTVDSAAGTVSITVTPVNDVPVAVADAVTTAEDVALTVPAPGVLGNDTDADGTTLTAVKVTNPAHGTVSVNANGSYTYTPVANYNGPDSFTYKANDGTVDSNVVTVSITVTAVNDAPVAVADAYSTNQGAPLAIAAAGVLTNDTDVENSPLTAVKVSDPAHGTLLLNANGSFTYTPATGYDGPDSFTYKANDGTADSNVATVSISVVGSTYAPLSPFRVWDSRGGAGPAGQVSAGGTRDITVTGVGGVPATGVTAVVLNVTAVNPSAGTFVTVWPAGETRPVASNLNIPAGDTRPNLVTVKVNAAGQISFYNDAGTVDIIADLAGWYGPGAGQRYTGLSPSRVWDSRGGPGPIGRVPAAGTSDVTVTGVSGVPATGVTAVVLNVTADNPSAGTFVTVWPTGEAKPVASNLNIPSGQTRPNLVIVKVGAGGKVSFSNDAGTVDLIADVAGYFGPTGSTFTSVSPSRVWDSRGGVGPTGRIAAGTTREITVTGLGGVPATGVTSVILNVTATNPSAATFVTVWPSGEAKPLASNLNIPPGDTRANLVIVKVGAGGKVSFTNDNGDVDLIADVAGWYGPAGP